MFVVGCYHFGRRKRTEKFELRGCKRSRSSHCQEPLAGASRVFSDIREIMHRVFFSRERQRVSRDLTFPAFAVCRPPFLLEEYIFPGWRERENVSIYSPLLLSISPF